jgi:hypothetical protein
VKTYWELVAAAWLHPTRKQRLHLATFSSSATAADPTVKSSFGFLVCLLVSSTGSNTIEDWVPQVVRQDVQQQIPTSNCTAAGAPNQSTGHPTEPACDINT